MTLKNIVMQIIENKRKIGKISPINQCKMKNENKVLKLKQRKK